MKLFLKQLSYQSYMKSKVSFYILPMQPNMFFFRIWTCQSLAILIIHATQRLIRFQYELFRIYVQNPNPENDTFQVLHCKNHLFKQFSSQFVSQSLNQPVCRSESPSVSWLVSRSVSQLMNQSVSKSVCLYVSHLIWSLILLISTFLSPRCVEYVTLCNKNLLFFSSQRLSRGLMLILVSQSVTFYVSQSSIQLVGQLVCRQTE